MPLVQTRGAASAQGFGEFAQVSVPIYIEDVFSTYLYTGTGVAQTITNGIDLSTNGGAVWIKGRNAAEPHVLVDSARGAANALRPNSTAASVNDAGRVSAFTTSGFSVGTDGETNGTTKTYVSWTFREQAKFFDVVTWSGNATSGRTIPHNLGSVPGCIIVKCTSIGATNWCVYHRGLAIPTDEGLYLSATQAAGGVGFWAYTAPTSAVFSLSASDQVNGIGDTYVAYLFAHNAGGFGLTGTDNVISCGSYTGDGSTDGSYLVSLGYEPQWVLVKRTDSSTNGGWHMIDTMRGMPTATSAASITALLLANTSAAEVLDSTGGPSATGFRPVASLTNTNAATYIYIAIRRGPMAVPTSGTSVFGINARTGTGSVATVTGGQTDDAVLIKNRGSAVASLFSSRLTGTGYLVTSSTAAEVAAGTTILQANPWDVMDGVKVGTTSTITNASGNTFINYLFKRAPSFFDEVCYTGAGSPYSPVAHNLTVVPQMIIGRFRSDVGQWYVYHEALGATGTILFNSNAVTVTAPWTLTNTTFQYDTLQINTLTYVTYLFATLAGVSKVGSYTGNGTTQTIDCGFGAGGARFVLIKRSDASGDWYVYDTARGMTVLTDPYYLINSTAAEVATLGSVTTVSTGFALDSTILADINVSAGSYIFLAIA